MINDHHSYLNTNKLRQIKRMQKCLLFIICFNYLCLTKCITIEVLNYGDPNTCNKSEIFNADLMKCQLCDAKKLLVPSKDSKFSYKIQLFVLQY